MPRDIALEPLLPVDDIQGDILSGLPKRHERLMFFRITDAAKFKRFLKNLQLTSLAECLADRKAIDDRKKKGDNRLIPTPGLNIAFTAAGLGKLGVALPAVPALDAFRNGMAKRQPVLGDPAPTMWKILKPSVDLHGVFILTGASVAEVVDIMSLRLVPAVDNGWKLLSEQPGDVRPDPVKGHEHFGYADGVSQPGVRGRVAEREALTPTVAGGDDNQGARGQNLLWPGEFLFGYPGQDAGKPFEQKGAEVVPPVPFMKDGAFLVFRRLAQQVPEFNASVNRAAAGIGGGPEKPTPDQLGAQIVGRWKSGAPLVLAPGKDDLEFSDGSDRVNDFVFDGDREGVKCPWAAHIRKAYPRDDARHNTSPTPADVVGAKAFNQTRRMMRRGITFGPEVTEKEALAGKSGSEARGLLFKCYVTSIEEQFEFVQQQWCNAIDFSQPGSGVDAIIGQSAAVSRPFLGAAPASGDPTLKPKLKLGLFVEMQGGEYFFAPSIAALKAL